MKNLMPEGGRYFVTYELTQIEISFYPIYSKTDTTIMARWSPLGSTPTNSVGFFYMGWLGAITRDLTNAW